LADESIGQVVESSRSFAGAASAGRDVEEWKRKYKAEKQNRE
jgi:hypothetical protein